MPDLLSVIHSQRACRRFDTNGEVADSDIEKILTAAVHAPSAENTQPWVFVVTRDEQIRGELTRWWTETWNAGGGEWARQAIDDKHLFTDVEDGVANGGFASAPVIVTVCVDTERVAEVHWQSSVYPAVQNLLLAASSFGYGTCLTTGLTVFGIDHVRELLKLPTSLVPLAAVYLGVPARKLAPPRRRPAGLVTFREHFGNPWTAAGRSKCP
ncbi:nitroreductase family protein [Mycobacterium sp. E2497]|uniref:nitroreductase family protein n=1 Tax=Mycobacterium sp. E2497 TaxID=1834135 RepID=UPI0007FEA5DC|nr:nitroreductase family protein [Mycobacterium sp. E2497]OBI17581.1 nitroreductase [Mycobacterium sp. E2497]